MTALLPFDRKKLIEALSAKTGTSHADADRHIAALIEIVSAMLKENNQAELIGVGALEKNAIKHDIPDANQQPLEQERQ